MNLMNTKLVERELVEDDNHFYKKKKKKQQVWKKQMFN
jgi:hypothetical protein